MKSLTLYVTISLGVLGCASAALAQDEADAAPDAGVADAAAADGGTEAVVEAVAPIVTTTVIQEAHDQDTRLDEIRTELEGQPEVGAVRARLATSVTEFAAFVPTIAPEALERAGRSELMERLRHLGTIEEELSSDADALAGRLAHLAELTAEIDAAQSRWTTTEEELSATDGAPPAALSQAAETRRRVDEELTVATERTSMVVALQAQLIEHQQRVEEARSGVEEARGQMRAQLLRRVTPPLWEAFSAESPGPPTLVTVEGAWEAFYSGYSHKFPIHGGLLLGLLLFVFALSRWTAHLTGSEAASVAILSRPLAAAAMVALVSVRFLYTQAPAAIFHIAAVLALAPLIRLLPLLVSNRALHRPLWGLMALFSLQELAIFAPLSGPVARLLSLGISLALLGLVVWVLRRNQAVPDEDAGRIERAVPHALKVVAALLVVSALAEVFGYTNLAALLTPGLLIDIYVVLLLVAAVRVVDALVTATLMSDWAKVSHAVRSHGPRIGGRIRGALHYAAIAVWFYGTLRVFDLDEFVIDSLVELFGASVSMGSWALSLADVVSFGLVIWISVLLARFTVFILEEEVFTHLDLPRGAPSTISRLVRYSIWALGFVFAIGAAGVDTSSLALLVSALSVGIGFGLQNIVNNFVSGLILIFERPIREGDTVELSGMIGKVKAIGLRASVVRTVQGSEVIVPNADLVSGQVINWTLSDQERRVDVPIGVAYGTDPEVILAMLTEVAASIEEVQKTPAPLPLFKGFGDSSLDFELRFWVNLRHDWLTVASNASVEINRRLADMNIEIPFPQRDLHVRSIEPDLTKLLEPK